MKKEVVDHISNLIKTRLNMKIKLIEGNLFLIEDNKEVQLTSIWFRGNDCTFYGLNNKYLSSTKDTIIIKEECGVDKVYIIPSKLIESLDITKDEANNRSVPNIYNDNILLKNKEKYDISNYRVI